MGSFCSTCRDKNPIEDDIGTDVPFIGSKVEPVGEYEEYGIPGLEEVLAAMADTEYEKDLELSDVELDNYVRSLQDSWIKTEYAVNYLLYLTLTFLSSQSFPVLVVS